MALRDGLRIEQIMALLQNKKGESDCSSTRRSSSELALNPPASLRDEYPFLKQAPEGRSLEGFLAGDTWSVAQDIKPLDLIRDLLAQLERQARGPRGPGPQEGRRLLRRPRPRQPRRARDHDRRRAGQDRGGLLEPPRPAAQRRDRRPHASRPHGRLRRRTPWRCEDLGLEQWPKYVFWDTVGVADLATVQVSPRTCSPSRRTSSPGLPDWPIATPTRASIEAALKPTTASGPPVLLRLPRGGHAHFAKTAGAAQPQHRHVQAGRGQPCRTGRTPRRVRGRPAHRRRPGPLAAADAAARPARLARLRERLAAEGRGRLLRASRRENTRYLTGFVLGEGEEKVAGVVRPVPGLGRRDGRARGLALPRPGRARSARPVAHRGCLRTTSRVDGQRSSPALRPVGGRGRGARPPGRRGGGLREPRDLDAARGGGAGRGARARGGLGRGAAPGQGARGAGARRQRLRGRGRGAHAAAAGHPAGRHGARAGARPGVGDAHGRRGGARLRRGLPGGPARGAAARLARPAPGDGRVRSCSSTSGPRCAATART